MPVWNSRDRIPEGSIYVDRTSKYGNPYPPRAGRSLEESLHLYRLHLWAMLKDGRVTLEELASLHGKDLVCHCKPKPCHADIIEAAAAWAHDVLHG